ncbi:MAG: IS3 family transposase [Roseivirga sp.]
MISIRSPLSIRDQCKLLSLSRASYYYQAATKQETELCNEIADLYAQYPVYGYRRIRAILLRRGYQVNGKGILRLMRQMNLQAVYPSVSTSRKSFLGKSYPYLLSGLRISSPNQVWQVEITYLPTRVGFVYLIALIDVYSRFIVGARLSNTLCSHSCLRTLELALLDYGCPEIINSDQGSQFTSVICCDYVSSSGIKLSMTGSGRCRDNAYIERLWRTLKSEGSRLHGWEDMVTMRGALPDWVVWYNESRLHQGLNYRFPKEVYECEVGNNATGVTCKSSKIDH